MPRHTHENSFDPAANNVYRFDDILVDTQNFVVTKNGEPVMLAPRAFDVLELLLRSGGQVVDKRQMFDQVWRDTFVSDNALTKVIKELRHSLGDSAEDPRYIETVPKRGYRFIGTLVEAPAGDNGNRTAVIPTPADTPTTVKPWIAALAAVILVALAGLTWLYFTTPATNGSPTTIAVLPFKPLDAESRDESLEFGMAATLITRLSNLRGVVVRPMASTRKFAEPSQDPIKAGEELQTVAVLDGSIQKAGDRVRVSVRLLDVRSGTALWSEQFDENFTDIFKVQDSIAERIAGVLALRLSRDEQERLAKHMTESPEAYELYLRGQFLWHRRGPDWIRQSLDAYKRALEKDPNFALAHIGVAEANIMLSGHRLLSVDEAATNAEPSIARALEIDARLAQAHNALAELKYQYQYDWRGAETEFKIALDLNPNVAWIHQAYGWFLMSDGRFEEANTEMESARQLDPSSLTLNAARGRLYYFSRQYDRAIEHYQDLLRQEPGDTSVHYALYTTYIQKKMYREAVESLMKAQGTNGMSAEVQGRVRDAFETGGWAGFLRRIITELDALRAQTGHQSVANYAHAYLHLGDKEQAIYWLQKVFDARDVSVVQAKVEPAYDVLRDDPRFAELLKKIGQ